MPRIGLFVPQLDCSEAARLGAERDGDSARWYVPDGADAACFARWLPFQDEINVRAPAFFIATTSVLCRRCKARTQIHGFALPAGHETLYVDDDPDADVWQAADDPTFVCYLGYLAAGPAMRIRGVTPHYRYSYRHSTQEFYWANCCQHCGRKLGDYDLYCEPGEGFMPLTRDQAARVTLQRIDEPFAAAAGGWSIGVDLFEFMPRR